MIIVSLATYFAHGILNNYLDTDKASILVWGLMSLFICLSNVSLIKRLNVIKICFKALYLSYE